MIAIVRKAITAITVDATENIVWVCTIDFYDDIKNKSFIMSILNEEGGEETI